jgi:DEAD/DEAH box helicase domain-containing protein
MDVAALLKRIQSRADYGGQLEHVEILPERAGRFDSPQAPLPEALVRLLTARGIEQLYCHQVAALEAARAGRDFVVVTGTASGKTLCYNLPILEAAITEPARAAPPHSWRSEPRVIEPRYAARRRVALSSQVGDLLFGVAVRRRR